MPTQAEIEAAIETTKQHGAKTGQDVHRLTAARIFNIKPEDVTSEQRRYAKTVNYISLYSEPMKKP